MVNIKMLTVNQRRAMFLIGCMGARASLAYLAFHDSTNVLAYIIGCIGLGFAVIWLFDLRKTGIETGGEAIWWNHLRPVHAALYLVAAYLIITLSKRREASYVIVFDALVGLVAYANHRKLI
jgi:hypothetical protein